MATCGRCGRRGLFLRLDAETGLCADCLERYRQEQIMEEFARIRAEEERKKEQKFLDGVKPVKGNLLVTDNGQKISIKVIGSKFNLKKMLHIQGAQYALDECDWDAVRADVVCVGDILLAFSGAHPNLPGFFIDSKKIEFKPAYSPGTHCFTTLSVNPLTATGKPPKFALRVRLGMSLGQVGSIHYLQDGTIGKVELAYDVERQYRITMSVKKGQLVVDKITAWTPDTGTTELYRYAEA